MINRVVFPLRRRKHARPRELLAAALSLFIEKGFAATRAEEIAERAGVSKGTLYLYFASKEELFSDLIAERFLCEFPFESGACLEARSGSDVLHDVVATWCAALNKGAVSGVVKLLFTEVHHFPALAQFWTTEVMAPTRAVVRDAVQRGIAAMEFRAVDPDAVMNVVVLPIVATCLYRRTIEPYSPSQFPQVGHEAPGCELDLLLHGLTHRHDCLSCRCV